MLHSGDCHLKTQQNIMYLDFSAVEVVTENVVNPECNTVDNVVIKHLAFKQLNRHSRQLKCS